MSMLKYWLILGPTLMLCVFLEILARKYLESWGHAIAIGVLFAVYANVFHYVESKRYPEIIHIRYEG